MSGSPTVSRDGRRLPHEEVLTRLARVGLAGRTAFYLILTALTVRIAFLSGRPANQANAHGALAIVSESTIGKLAIGAVAAGFVGFGVARIAGSILDHSVSAGRRVMTTIQGVFYLFLAYVPAAFLAGDAGSGSQQQQQQTSAELLKLPAGQAILVVVGLIFIGVCVQQVRGAWARSFREGLDLDGAPAWVEKIADQAGTIGITARALVFLPVGIFLIVAAVQDDAKYSYGTDVELLKLSDHAWGIAILTVLAVGLAVFVVFSGIETVYRKVISAT